MNSDKSGAIGPPDRLASAPDPLASGRSGRLWLGVRAAFAGLGFALRHRRVLLHALLAVVVYVAVWAVVVWQAAAHSDAVILPLLGPKGAQWWQAVGWDALYILALIAWWLGALILAFVVATPLMAPFFSLLAEAAEVAFYGTPPRSIDLKTRIREMTAAVGRAAVLATVQIVGALLIWAVCAAIGLIFPPAGAFLGAVLGGLWSSLWYAMLAVSHALENHHVPLGVQLNLPSRMGSLLLGTGLVGQLLAWFPPAIPFVVVGASVLVFRLEQHGHVGLSLRAKDAKDGRAS